MVAKDLLLGIGSRIGNLTTVDLDESKFIKPGT